MAGEVVINICKFLLLHTFVHLPKPKRMQWIDDLYKNTHKIWEQTGRDPSGYAIFYSPVESNPDILIIGYNPGGDESSFDETSAFPPKKHDYIIGNYKMAERMRFVFESAGIFSYLKDSVKMNMIYFRTKNASGVEEIPFESIQFCKSQIKHIIDALSPKIILAEGFTTFDPLINILEVKKTGEDSFNNRCVMKYSNYNEAKILGIRHPTGSYGLRNEDLIEIGRLIKNQLNEN